MLKDGFMRKEEADLAESIIPKKHFFEQEKRNSHSEPGANIPTNQNPNLHIHGSKRTGTKKGANVKCRFFLV